MSVGKRPAGNAHGKDLFITSRKRESRKFVGIDGNGVHQNCRSVQERSACTFVGTHREGSRRFSVATYVNTRIFQSRVAHRNISGVYFLSRMRFWGVDTIAR
jgi:hypothetical protein